MKGMFFENENLSKNNRPKNIVWLTEILDLLDRVDILLVDIDWWSSVTEENDPLLFSQSIQDIVKQEIKLRFKNP